MMASIRQGLEAAMQVTASRPMARGKIVDLALILCAAALVLVTVGLTLLGDVVRGATGGLAEATGLGGGALANGVLRAAWFALSIVVVMLLYRLVPARGLRVRDSLAGAIVTAVLLQLISLASGFDPHDKTTRLSVVYGSLTAALVFLYSVYLYASALLLGAEIAAAWRDRRPRAGRRSSCRSNKGSSDSSSRGSKTLRGPLSTRPEIAAARMRGPVSPSREMTCGSEWCGCSATRRRGGFQ